MKNSLIQEYRQKLKNRKGSALLLSLLFSVVSVAIAAVILNAAMSANGRSIETAESSEPYYLVTSLFSVFEAAGTKKYNPAKTPAESEGMAFTAELSFDPSETRAVNIKNNNPFENGITAPLPAVLEAETNLGGLQDYVAYCLAAAMLSNQETDASRNFTVTVGGAEAGNFGGHTYELDCTISVSPVDYTITIEVTAIRDTNGGTPGETLALPEVHTLVFPTERVYFLELATTGLGEPGDEKIPDRPVRARFVYQKAKYL